MMPLIFFLYPHYEAGIIIQVMQNDEWCIASMVPYDPMWITKFAAVQYMVWYGLLVQ